MEPIPSTSSGGNATDAQTAGPSSTLPTPVQPSDDKCIGKRLQSVSESEKISEIGSSGLHPANDIDTEQSIDGDPDIHRKFEVHLQAVGPMLEPSANVCDLNNFGGLIETTTDPEVLHRLTSSVTSALDKAAAVLLQMRADTKIENKALIKACHDNDVGAVRKLLTEGCSVHETSQEGECLLSIACSAGYYKLAQVLLAMHANVEDRGTKGDYTPLMEAASFGFVEIVRLLLVNGAVVNALSSTGNTPLMYACAGGHIETVKVLLKHGANVENHNTNGHTPLMEAASAGNITVANVLNPFQRPR